MREYIVSTKYVKGDKLSGKDLKCFPDRKSAIQHADKLAILKTGTVLEVWEESYSSNGIIYDKIHIYSTE